MAEIQVKAVMNNLPSPGGKVSYRLAPASRKTIKEDEFVGLLAAKAKQDKSEARFWCDNFAQTFATQLLANNAIDLGFLYAKLTVDGSLKSASDQPTKEGNPVRAAVWLKGDLAESVKSLDVVNTTITIELVLNSVQQDDAADLNLLTEAGKRVVLNVRNGKIDINADDEGVWLEKNGTVVKTAVVDYSDSDVARVHFTELPEDGVYTLVISARNGEDSAKYTPARKTRNVQVVNA